MRIAILGSRGYPSTYGGFETLVRRLAPFLVEQGHSVTVYCRPPYGIERDGDPRVQRHFTWGVDRKTLSTLTYGASASLHASRRNFDSALILNPANGYFLPLFKRAGIPTAVNVDGLEWQRAKWNKIGRRVFFEGARLCGKYADELVYDSEALKPHWTATFGVARGVFIPYGADIAEAASEVPIEELGLEIGKFLLVVARLVPENSIDLFLDACALLPAELPIIVVGSGHDREPVVHRLRRVSETRKQVRLLGHVSDQTFLRALWVHCGAYWHGHSVGGTNPALLQAMSSGAPTLALDTPFNAEVLRNPRQLVARDPELLAGRIRALLLSPETQQSWRASQQATIKEFYQWDSVCRRYDEVLQRIA